MVSGESHFFEGRRYLLRVVEGDGPSRVCTSGSSALMMRVRPGTGREKREQMLYPLRTVPFIRFDTLHKEPVVGSDPSQQPALHESIEQAIGGPEPPLGFDER